jgi:hypothetical protein
VEKSARIGVCGRGRLWKSRQYDLQARADQKFNDAESAWKTKVGAVGTEAGLDQKGAETREANARARNLENPPPKEPKEVSLAQQHADNATNQTKIMNVIRNGQLMAIHPEEMKQGDVMAGASAVGHAMGKGAQFQEIHSAIDKRRDAINKLDQPLSAEQIGKLTLAMKHTSDPGVWRTELESFLGTQQLTPSQQPLRLFTALQPR